MDERNKNEKWIASKRQRMQHNKKMEMEECIDSSSNEQDDDFAAAGNTDSRRIQGQDKNINVLEQRSLHADSESYNSTEANIREDIDGGSDNEGNKFQVISSSNSKDGSDYDSGKLGESLRDWVNLYEVKENAVDQLLELLHKNGYSDMPVSARTLMKTPR